MAVRMYFAFSSISLFSSFVKVFAILSHPPYELDAELLGQRVLDGEAVIPIGDLAQTANEARLVQRHDLLALGDAGGRKSIAAQADVRRQSCCFAVARQRYGRDDGAEVVCHVVGHDNDGTGAVLDV